MKPSDTPIAEASRRTDELLHSMGLGASEPPPSFTASMDKMRPEHLPKSLPQGIHGGALTAIVAGVAVVGGGIYFLTRHQAKTAERWTDRVQAEQFNTGLHR